MNSHSLKLIEESDQKIIMSLTRLYTKHEREHSRKETPKICTVEEG